MPAIGVRTARVAALSNAAPWIVTGLALTVAALIGAPLITPATAQQPPASPPASPPLSPAVEAQTPARNAMILFDGSGSMWGRIDGDKLAKFHLARDAFKKSLASPAPNVKLGLMSFGHRRQGDCSDVGVLTQPDTATSEHIAERIAAPLEKLNPKGKGPVTAALREAARILGKISGPKSIILVHDGLDNCGLDACSIVGELKDASPGLQINVVGLGLEDDEAKTYQCLTNATGGRHVDVRTAGDIPAAIETVTRMAFAASDPKPAAVAAAAVAESARRAAAKAGRSCR